MASKSTPHIAIVIPAYNEASAIGSVLDSLPTSIAGHPILSIVVNDGSSDSTGTIVKKYKNVKLINHVLNSGAGAATRTGINYAISKNVSMVATLDADGQHHIEDVIKIIKHALESKVDLTIGSRLLSTKGMPWYRVIGNKGLSFITFLIFGVFVTDSQSGLKVLNKKALEKIKFHSNSYAFCSEIIWQAHKSKLTIEEVPIRAIYTEYSLSKGQSNWNAIHIIGQMLKRRFLGFING